MIMNRVFYIFRHGETDWNKQSRCQGHTNTPLNDLGLKQAVALSKKLLDFPMDIVVTSDLERAYCTGEIVALKKQIPLMIDARLREMSYGEAEGLLYPEAIEKFGADLWQRFQKFDPSNDQIAFPGGETRVEARERFKDVLLELIASTDHQYIGISTHGGALRNILHSFLPNDHQLLAIPNCVVYRCEYRESTKSFHVDSKPM